MHYLQGFDESTDMKGGSLYNLNYPPVLPLFQRGEAEVPSQEVELQGLQSACEQAHWWNEPGEQHGILEAQHFA